MASTITRKRRRASTRVGEMTKDELRDMMESLIDRKMSEWAGDPRIARRRAEIAANAATAREEYRKNSVRRGTVKDLLADLA